MVRRKLQNQRGFSLVELLIVVAIIGVLATVGIPTFRRMIQKSRKSEAQVNLGNLFTIESAFNSEYGTYGNNLQVMGYQVDGNANTMTYLLGFAATAGACAAIPARMPTQANAAAQSAAIQNALPNYYGAGGAAAPAAPAKTDHQFGRLGVVGAACTAPPAGPNALPVALGGNFTVTDGGVAPAFVAVAAGFIQPGCNKDTGAGCAAGAGGSPFDQWTINETRTLANTADGVF